jgi:hypothetical protein
MLSIYLNSKQASNEWEKINKSMLFHSKLQKILLANMVFSLYRMINLKEKLVIHCYVCIIRKVDLCCCHCLIE